MIYPDFTELLDTNIRAYFTPYCFTQFRVYVCIYSLINPVNTDHYISNPFLVYHLTRENNEHTTPYTFLTTDSNYISEILVQYETYVQGCLLSNNDCYIFVQLNPDLEQTSYLNFTFDTILVEEIINRKATITGEPIDLNVVKFLRTHTAFCYPCDPNKTPNQTLPICSVRLHYDQNMANYELLHGPLYSAHNWKNYVFGYSTMFSLETTETHPSGINMYAVKFAVFLGRKKTISHNSENQDTSQIKTAMLESVNLKIKQREMLTRYITDYEGKWKTKYDSIQINNLMLEDDTTLQNKYPGMTFTHPFPIVCVKNVQQTTPIKMYLLKNTK